MVYNGDFERDYRPPLNGEIRYPIRFDRQVNGIPFPHDSLTFQINGNGQLVGYERRWNPSVSFQALPPAISQKNADEAYRKGMKPLLQYLSPIPYKDEDDRPPYLAYTFNPYNLLDAKTGELIGEKGAPVQAAALKTISDKPLAEKPAEGQMLTKEQAIDRVKALVPIPADAELQNASFSENFRTKNGSSVPTWNFSWKTGTDAKGGAYLSASVNASNGDLMNYNNGIRPLDNEAAKPEEAKLPDKDSLRAAAIDFVKKVLPHYADQLAVDEAVFSYEPSPKGTPYAYVPFKRVVNGVATESEGASVQFDGQTGELAGFWSNFSTIAYPSDIPKVIGEEKAEERLLSRYRLELQYFVPATEYIILKEGGKPDPAPPHGSSIVSCRRTPARTSSWMP
ncbi:hypothetical protein N6H14_09330 [Paenibacillus sp. CC-CFT747]|nr:hypothetical protein N6H14_09330 [Paenibacillus sp. CC-CFT747]